MDTKLIDFVKEYFRYNNEEDLFVYKNIILEFDFENKTVRISNLTAHAILPISEIKEILLTENEFSLMYADNISMCFDFLY